MSRAATLFTTDFSAARPGGSSADAPIFVPGLGLSGSTRLAQILASHPAVEGTMEWTEIG